MTNAPMLHHGGTQRGDGAGTTSSTPHQVMGAAAACEVATEGGVGC